ncbi:Cytochrome P450 71A4 [Acorus calamus]|uniref:Cytochrome P450 71A4 n=2 Tax=Acorus calamus TaxID=4465 RepID=A0AAV9FLZ8_ACOCL|nr:Cytochrome P450 71A4 [Acorus calamus]
MSVTVATILFIVPLLLLLLNHKRCSTKKTKLPPSPSKLPIIGNLHQLGSPLHRTLCALSQKYGPIMHLQLGCVSAIVISSPDLAEEIFKTHDLNFASRPSLAMVDKLVYDSQDIAFTPYGDYWRQARKICVLHLLSSKRVQSFGAIREEEVELMIEKVSRKSSLGPVNLTKLLNSLTLNTISRVALGTKHSLEEGVNDKLCKLIAEFSTLFETSRLDDYFPYLAWLYTINGMNKRLTKWFQDWDGLLDQVINDHVVHSVGSQSNTNADLVDVLLSLQKDQDSSLSLTMKNIKAIITDMFSAGTDTSFALLDWTMAELMRNQKAMKKVQDEIRCIMKDKTKIEESDIAKMAYLYAVIKETLRLHPPATMLLPRESMKEATIRGYRVPAKTTVMVNAWAIGRDPKLWEDPEEFRPERFLNSSIDFKGNDFQLIPFGSGRRICPGMQFAMAEVELALASLLYRFDWRLPEKMKAEELDMREAPGLTVRRMPNLLVIATPHQSRMC